MASRLGGPAVSLLALGVALAFGAALPPGAAAAPVPLGGSPLNVIVSDLGQLQAFRLNRADPGLPGIFYPPSEETGDAGFFLAFPAGLGGDATPRVFGFVGRAGPKELDNDYTPISQEGVTGTGTAADPLREVTSYSADIGVTAIFTVTQTTTYVNGSQEFRIHWDVHNDSGSAVTFKAIAAADFFFEGSDAGTGIFTPGPPRFIGGTNIDSGSSGGLVEVSPAWDHYQALEFGPGATQIWGKVRDSATSLPTFDETVIGEPVDDAGGVEWDQSLTGGGLAGGATRSFELIFRSAVPSALQLNPTNSASRQGVPVGITATATDSNGQPYAGKTLRYSIAGGNTTSGATTLSPTGSAVVTDPGTNAGTDTVVVYVDFNNDGIRESVEPQASALATFVDGVPPTCSLKASGELIGGGAGKPLVITVNCGEGATVTVAPSLQPLPGARSSASASKRKAPKIKLRPTTAKVKAGRPFSFKFTIPRKVRKKYAGQKMKATIRVTARDPSGNVKKTKVVKKIRLAELAKRR